MPIMLRRIYYKMLQIIINNIFSTVVMESCDFIINKFVVIYQFITVHWFVFLLYLKHWASFGNYWQCKWGPSLDQSCDCVADSKYRTHSSVYPMQNC